MSFLERLLGGAEVDWRPIGEVCNILNGYAFKSKNFNSNGEGLPLIRIRDVNTGLSNTYYSGEYDNRFLVNKGDLLIGMDGDFQAIRWSHNKALLNQRVCRLQDYGKEIIPDFMFYIVQGELDRIHRSIPGSTVKHLSSRELERSLIPLPSITVQKEILRLLESFTDFTTQLTKELSTELKARNQQFNYYKEELFKFKKDKVQFEPLHEIGEFQRGKRFVKTDLISEGVPTIHYGEMYTYYGPWADKTISFVSQELVDYKKLRMAENGDVVIVAAGETIEDIGKGTAWLGNKGAVIHDACFGFRSSLNPKYVAYFTRTRQFHDQIRKHIRTGKISAINSKGLSKAIIPVPSPEEQERIVSILDRYDTLTKSISTVLPEEIELREKQYEYYRDKLLTFPKKIEA